MGGGGDNKKNSTEFRLPLNPSLIRRLIGVRKPVDEIVDKFPVHVCYYYRYYYYCYYYMRKRLQRTFLPVPADAGRYDRTRLIIWYTRP